MALTYFKKMSLVLSNEDYTNAGLLREDMKKAIEKYVDGVSHCKDWPINTNIEVCLKNGMELYMPAIFQEIQETLDDLAFKKNIKING